MQKNLQRHGKCNILAAKILYTMEYFVTASNIVKKFAAHTALQDVSISVPKGKIFGLLGPNGAGKTTLIRILNRITVPDSGEVTFGGHPLCPSDVQDIGYLPEERGLYKKMKVGEQAMYLAQLKGMAKADARARLEEWFHKFGIMEWWDKKVDELSKGMAQKVQFICTVLHKPGLLIFDEPFSGFDPVNAELLKQEILQLKEQGHTIIFSTHNMASVEEICDEIALINHSRVVLSGNVEAIKNSHRTGRYEAVITEGSIPDQGESFRVVGSVASGQCVKYVIEKLHDASNSQIVSEIARRAEIRSFSEQIPTMHEIFLKTVSTINN